MNSQKGWMNGDDPQSKPPQALYDQLTELALKTLNENGVSSSEAESFGKGFGEAMRKQSGHESPEYPVAPLRYCGVSVVLEWGQIG